MSVGEVQQEDQDVKTEAGELKTKLRPLRGGQET